MDRYQDRQAAGRVLAHALSHYAGREDVIILALPRGGVPVAFEIAKALHAPLDVFIVRKLGVPGHEELALGAIAMGGVRVFNDDIIRELSISEQVIDKVTLSEKEELQRREKAYRGKQAFPSLKDKTIILVDDGIATGATIRAAILALRHLQPTRIVVAVPVAAQAMCAQMEALVDDFICPLKPEQFSAVGAWYQDFSQTGDEEVYHLLKEAKHRYRNPLNG